ncbi:unnamed protein product [Caenorhabditis brenneri]
MIFRFFLLALLVVSISSEIDCSTKDTCFGEPHNCDPVSDCQSLIQFDDSGNLVLLLRNFTDSNEYAAIPIRRYPDETIEFLLCVPLQQNYLRVRAEMDGFVLPTDEILNSFTPITSKEYSRCDFDSSHLPENFRTESSITVSRGSLDGLAIINDGVLLHPVNANLDFEDDSEEVDLFSTYYFLGRPVQEETVEKNGWWRYVRSPSDSDVDSQNVIEDEKRESRIQMNTEVSTAQKAPTMHAEASQTTMGTIDLQTTPQSQECTDNSADSDFSSPKDSPEEQLIQEYFGDKKDQKKEANSDTAKSIAGAIGLVSLFAMMRASTEEEIEAERQAQGQQLYTEVAIDRSTQSEQNQASLPAGASSPPSSSSTSSDGSATSSSSYSPSESSSQSNDEESQEDDEIQQTVVPIKKPGPTPTKRPSTSPDSSGPTHKCARKL